MNGEKSLKGTFGKIPKVLYCEKGTKREVEK
jgi:hypothetical protein